MHRHVVVLPFSALSVFGPIAAPAGVGLQDW